MYSFILRDDSFDSGLSSLSKQFPAPVAGDVLQLPMHRGTGYIRGLHLEEGLYVRYSQVCYKEDTEIVRLAGQPESDRIFSLCYQLTPGSLKLVKPHTHSVLPCLNNGNIFLTSNQRRFSVQIPEGIQSRTIEVLFTRGWLAQHLTGMEEKIRVMEDSLTAVDPSSILMERTLSTDEALLAELEPELRQPRSNPLTTRARVLLLLSNIIGRWPRHTGQKFPTRKTWHVQTIQQVEQRLVESLEDMLPSQKQLAREFALSESTLKRHFKAVYGKTMYDYYLEKKMELAKWLLQERKTSVSETAYKLGYEKVSAFISMFKKYHHILPGSLK
ncbi:MAG: helix-turn-helix domain-containing protein [Bacteroidetes bacterium]|nr:helix-turn-helix domain-containing protein [Bacteroidota bacterium]